MFHLVTLPREQGETLIYLFKYNRGMGTQQNRQHTSTDTETVSGGPVQFQISSLSGREGRAKRRGAAPCDGRSGLGAPVSEETTCAAGGRMGKEASLRRQERARCAGLRENYQ